jgi:hypothetical protein
MERWFAVQKDAEYWIKGKLTEILELQEAA